LGGGFLLKAAAFSLPMMLRFVLTRAELCFGMPKIAAANHFPTSAWMIAAIERSVCQGTVFLSSGPYFSP
jgi:hypothetical protein